MINGSYLSNDGNNSQNNSELNSGYNVEEQNAHAINDFSSIRDSREIFTMPELNRSTLMDQIDYDLDNYKINESSMYTNSIDQSKHSIPKQQFMRAQESRDSEIDVKPKFMNFLNKSEKTLK
jgi:hypothetical protein